MKSNTPAPLLWLKRFLCYSFGLFIMAIGVVFSSKSGLGVSPVTCLANVLYRILGVDRGLTALSLGVCTTLSYCLYILIELIMLRRKFKASMLLQIIASTIFGFLVSAAMSLFAFLPSPEAYWLRLIYLLCSVPLVAFGVMLYLAPNILPTPGEGLSMSLSITIGKGVGTAKLIVDCCLVALSAITSLLYFHGLVGVREGTLICALLVGPVMKRFMAICNPALLRFVERETKLERAISAVGENAQLVLPKIVITISREFGCGGYEIGQKLAEALGISFYDKQLEPMEAEESGLPISFIREHEARMTKSRFALDLLSSAYAMYNNALEPMDRLFAARTAILRRIAASDESCVIMGRCSDYILYKDPNSFRIFIHAPTDYRVAKASERLGVSPAAARAIVENTDAGRAKHYSQYAGREWGNTKYYNLALDSEQLGIEGSVRLILEAVEIWRNNRTSLAVSDNNNK